MTYTAPTGAEIARWLQTEAAMTDAMGPTRTGEMLRHAAAYITEHEALLTRIHAVTVAADNTMQHATLEIEHLRSEVARLERLAHSA